MPAQIDVVIRVCNRSELTTTAVQICSSDWYQLEDETVGSAAALMLQPGGERIDSIGLSADVTLAGFPRHWGKPVRCAFDAVPALAGPSGTARPGNGAMGASHVVT